MKKVSSLKTNPKSKIIKHGYINIYSKLSQKEQNQLKYKIRYKKENPNWDESQVYLSKRFAELKNDNLIVLDAGCGHGNYVIDENRNKINWAVGVDLSDEVTSKNICLDEILHEDLENLTVESNTFDVCVSLWVFEHLQNPEKVVNQVHRVLKKDGLFLLVAPNKNYIPLVFVRILHSRFLNRLLNKFLFGRKSEDVFDSYYRANTVSDLKKFLMDKFEIIDLRYNYDPSYLSFCPVSYRLFNFTNRIFGLFGCNCLKPHIIGVVRKI